MAKNQLSPKFKIDDRVQFKERLGCTSGVIYEVDRIFKVVDKDGNFERNGLNTSEKTIHSTQLVYRFDGITLEVDFPEQDFGGWIRKAHTEVSKFYCWAYTVRAEQKDYNIGFLEKQVKKIS